jgi:hypothetical protein
MNLFLLHTTHRSRQPAAAASQAADVNQKQGMKARNDGAPPGAPVS